ncbi:hypothetical protein N7G274_006361 [Stereocaulon virgatum]|uniref:Uncharacterized protein n=1 Tax=Stereocaulon virgatum TaxID=373712 RepID=A0ABR4A5F8_9LECA
MLRLQGRLNQAGFWCRQRLGALRNRLRPGRLPEEQSQQSSRRSGESIHRPQELSPIIEERSELIISIITILPQGVPERFAMLALRQWAAELEEAQAEEASRS